MATPFLDDAFYVRRDLRAVSAARFFGLCVRAGLDFLGTDYFVVRQFKGELASWILH